MTMFSVHSFADEIQIGSGESTDANLPTHSYYKYSLTQQIYTAAEIEDAGGGAGTINSIAFYNGGSTKTRNFSIYLVNTDKESFSSATDWISVTANDLVYSGEVEMTAGTWKTIPFDNPFSYDGGNLAVVVDDNTGNDVSGMACRIFIASETQSIYYRNDYTNPDPTNPTISGTPTTYKNQIILDIETASVTCAKPKNFNAENISAHSALLTWTAGAEGQSNWDVYVTTTANDVPDENTTPTYQVTECSKALTNLIAQTTYYAYVRANCGGGDKSKWANKTFTTTREALAVDANNPYSQDFETNNDWGFTNGTLTNNWCWGNTVNNGGQKSMYVSKDGGTTYEYAHGNTAIYASKLFNFGQGTYTFVFDWNAKGESTYDYLRVALAPGDVEFTAGTSLYSGVGTSSLPNGWIALDGGSKLNLKDNWQTQTAEANVSGTYTMVFLWRNDGSGGTQPPAAIDNISINFMTCPRPTNLTASNIAGRTATLTWTENGTATNWVLQYATDASFTENLVEVNVSGTASKDLVDLSPETKYYARVKSVLGSDESSWSDVKDFTTTATCVKPTSVTANNITAYTATISWTNGEEGQDAWEISYSTSTQSNPENGTVLPVTTNPYTLNGLTPETSYYVYVRADCGSEDGKSAWSSYKYFTTLATCVKPTGLTANNVTATTATITWTAGEAGQDAWNLQYKKSSDSEWQTVAVTTNSYNLTNLSPVTTYNVRVQADCGEGDLSQWTSNTNFTTECAALTLPYTCDFEGAVETSGHFASYPVPKCWDRIEMQYGNYSPYTYYPYVYNYSSDAHSGTKSLRMYRTPNSANETIILPAIDEAYEMNNLQIRFWAKAGSSNNTLSVGIMEGDSFVPVSTAEGVSTTYAEYTVLLSDYTGDGRNIAIKCGTSSSYLYYYIDDVTVEEIPSCFIPTGLAATVNSATETILTWTAGLNETDWELEVTADGSIAQLIPVSGTPTYTLSTTRATTYTVRVRANCGEGDFSDWSNPVNFTSYCGVLAVDASHPFLEDFENVDASDFPPICWEKFSYEMSAYNYWNLSANNGLNSSAAFSYWSEGYAFLVMPQMHIDGNATLSFDYLISSGDYDESCSVVVSTGEMTYNDFSQTIWAADGNNLPSGKASCSISLADFNDQDIYIAFKFKGLGTSGCTWYVDNVEIAILSTLTMEIVGYGDSGNAGYYLIASPMTEVTPSAENGFLTSNYDLYAFDQSQDLEWRNFKATSFNLVSGQGYLYASQQNTTLSFTGRPYSGNGEIELVYDEGKDFAGWNLIGNPFGTTAYLPASRSFYTLNADGSEVVAGEDNEIAVMQGIFVIAESEGDIVTFNVQNTNKSRKQVVMNLNRNCDASTGSATTIDRAIVRFDEGGLLPKFQLNPTSSKLYIPQYCKDYAVVYSEGIGEIPVNFKAAENGTYTITVNTEDVEMNYLHLIDNITGADADLLQTPSYNFEAKTTDYESRFKLVFVCGDGTLTGSGTFAFISNGKLVITNEGQATLQVIDMMGRVLSSETLSGNAEISFGQTPGVYMLRLINGNTVKTQKILIK